MTLFPATLNFYEINKSITLLTQKLETSMSADWDRAAVRRHTGVHLFLEQGRVLQMELRGMVLELPSKDLGLYSKHLIFFITYERLLVHDTRLERFGRDQTREHLTEGESSVQLTSSLG
jgi:hypothetical protein